MQDTNIVLSGVVGSNAYGLAGPNSDKDLLGVYLAPSRNVLGLNGGSVADNTIDGHEPDYCYHELGKYLSLALKSNPTVLELLWLPEYEVETEIGTALVLHRDYFPSTSFVRNAYGGYARQQADRLMRRNAEGKEGFSSDVKNRTEKHARHCMRLLLQGRELLSTGRITVDVSQYRGYLFDCGRMAAGNPEGFMRFFEIEMTRFNLVDSVLADEPDFQKINDFLINARLATL